MRPIARSLLAAASLMLFALAIVNSTASALVSPTGRISFRLGRSSIVVPSSGYRMACATGSIATTIDRTGRGTIAVPDLVLAGCADAIVVVTMAQLQPSTWVEPVILRNGGGLISGIRFGSAIPPNGIEFTRGTCRYRVGGTVDFLLPVGTPAAVVTVAAGLAIPSTASAVTVDTVIGVCPGIAVGAAVAFTTTLQMVQTLQIT